MIFDTEWRVAVDLSGRDLLALHQTECYICILCPNAWGRGSYKVTGPGGRFAIVEFKVCQCINKL